MFPGPVSQAEISKAVNIYDVQSTPDNSNRLRKSKKVRVIGSSKQINVNKEISKWMERECEYFEKGIRHYRLINIQSTLSKMDTFGTGTSCPS